MTICAANCLFLMILLGSWIYIISFHRISSPLEIAEIINLSYRGPVANETGCNVFNASHKKCLANVYFIGASKSGTTSMFEHLVSHPDIYAVERRAPATLYNNNLWQKHGNFSKKHSEIHRFDRSQYEYSNKYIEALHELSSSPPIPVTNKAPFIMHYTPNYLYAPSVPFDLHEMYRGMLSKSQPPSAPNSMVFIIMLRDPVARAFSSYWFKHSKLFNVDNQDGGSLDDFEENMEYEFALRSAYEKCLGMPFTFSEHLDVPKELYFNRLKACYHMKTSKDMGANITKWATANLFRAKQLGRHHVLKGIYYDQLYRWFHNFSPTFSISKNVNVSDRWKTDGSKKAENHQYRYCLVFFEHFVQSPSRSLLKLFRCMGIDTSSMATRNTINNIENMYSNKSRVHSGKLHAPNHRGSGDSYMNKPLKNKEMTYQSLQHEIINYNDYYKERRRRYENSKALDSHYREIQAKLEEFYEPYNELLYELLHCV